MLDGVIVPIHELFYNILYAAAAMLWGINQALLMVSYYLMTLTGWLVEQMFTPMLVLVSEQSGALLPLVFTVAFLLMAITYALSVFGVYRVVELKSALRWFLVAVFLFNFGPGLYNGLDTLRRSVGASFYGAVFEQLESGTSSIEGLDYIRSGDAGWLQVAPLENHFQPFLPTYDIAIDGSDVALAYLNADGCDVLRAPGCSTMGELPLGWYAPDSGFFDKTRSAPFFRTMSAEERDESLQSGMNGLWVLLSAVTLSLFALVEALINLCLALAFAFGFVSLFIAILFAFFKRTESVTHAAFDIILGLFVQSIINALLLALVMSFVIIAAGTGNGFLLFGVGFLGILLLVVLLFGAAAAILQSVNGLVNAFAAVTGGNLGAAGSVTQVAGALATGGATAAVTGSLTQAAGAALGPGAGQKAFYASQAFGRDTLAGRMAADVAAGSFAGTLGPVGALALAQTQPNFQHLPSAADTARRVGGGAGLASRALGTPIRVLRAHVEADEQTANLPPSEPPAVSRSPTPAAAAPHSLPPPAGRATALDVGALDAQDDDDFARLGARFEVGQRSGSQAEAKVDAEERGLRQVELLTRLRPTLASRPVGGVMGRTADGGTGWIDWAGRAEGHPPVPLGDVMDYHRQPRRNADGTPMVSRSPSGQYQLNIQDYNQVRPLPVSPDGSVPAGQHYRVDLAGGENGMSVLRRIDPPPVVQPQSAAAVPASAPSPAAPASVQAAAEPIRVLRGVGEVTARKLKGAGIETVGDLAAARPDDLTRLEGFSASRAGYMVRTAQDYVGTPAASVPEIAAAVDHANNDDFVRLRGGIQRALQHNDGRPLSPQQAAQAAQQQSLPPAGQDYLRLASALQLPPQQAAAVVGDVAALGQIGPQLRAALSASLANLTLPNGQQLDGRGIQQASAGLERAAQSLVRSVDQGQSGQEQVEADIQIQMQMAASQQEGL